jgi:hypothetical protein
MTRSLITLAALLALTVSATAEPARPLALHPDNSHYFLFRGKPAVLVTSGEHYGAVLNRDFDCKFYLDELKAHGFNLTRTFAGTYFEVHGSFNIVENTLAPARAASPRPVGKVRPARRADGGNSSI